MIGFIKWDIGLVIYVWTGFYHFIGFSTLRANFIYLLNTLIHFRISFNLICHWKSQKMITISMQQWKTLEFFGVVRCFNWNFLPQNNKSSVYGLTRYEKKKCGKAWGFSLHLSCPFKNMHWRLEFQKLGFQKLFNLYEHISSNKKLLWNTEQEIVISVLSMEIHWRMPTEAQVVKLQSRVT